MSARRQGDREIQRVGLQRRLRGAATDAERRLWQALRHRQLHGLRFRRQHPYDGYILDFVCLEANLVIEVDGGQHAANGAEDAIRTSALEKAGFKVLRFWNDQVLRELDAVLQRIWDELEQGRSVERDE